MGGILNRLALRTNCYAIFPYFKSRHPYKRKRTYRKGISSLFVSN